MSVLKLKPLVENFLKPEYKSEYSAGFDIYLQNDVTLTIGEHNIINLGFASEIPQGYVALLLPRSSFGIKGGQVRNTIGVIDSDYRGEWIAHITVDNDGSNKLGDKLEYKRGDRILQCLLVPVGNMPIKLSDTLSDTNRGAGGFGSTGK